MRRAWSRPIARPTCCSNTPSSAAARGLEVLIAGAGGAAHLPGMTAAKTALPVLGVPVQSRALNGLDSLLSIVQMPAGVPVATFAIGVPEPPTPRCSPPRSWRRATRRSREALQRAREAQTAAVLAKPDRALHDARCLSSMTIGIVGAGQLGQMLALAGYPLGLDFLFFDRSADTPAGAFRARCWRANSTTGAARRSWPSAAR